MKKAQAVVLVVSILAGVIILGVSLLVLSLYELKNSRLYLERLKSQYIAEAGVALAKVLLFKDKEENRSDSYADNFYSFLKGDDVDLDGDDVSESKWFFLQDRKGDTLGRFAVYIQDEASKLNVNFCSDKDFLRYGLSFFELNTAPLLEASGIKEKNSFFDFRKGKDLAYGYKGIDDDSDNLIVSSDGIDNDFDGSIDEEDEGIDEPDELGFGDDSSFSSAGEFFSYLSYEGLNPEKYFTLYSQEEEVDSFLSPRIFISSGSIPDILRAFLSSGVKAPYRKAANFIDFQDKDLAQTVLDKFYKKIELMPPLNGGFIDKGGYLYAPASSPESTWHLTNLNIPDGEYFCFFYSPFEDEPVGLVSMGDVIEEEVYSQEGLHNSIKVTSGELFFKVKPLKDKDCYLSYIELVSLNKKEGLLHLPVRGREPILINEVMVKPKTTLLVSSSQSPGGYWQWKGDYFENNELASGKEGEGSWVFDLNREGYFYISFLAGEPGGYVGEVSISGRRIGNIRDGTGPDSPLYINGKLSITIQNNSLVEKATFKGVIISQEPEGEFIEILNLSPEPVNLSGFVIEVTKEGQALLGWPAQIPEGVIIQPYTHLVLTPDKDDSSVYVGGNNLSFQGIWPGLEAVQLQFTGPIQEKDNLLPEDGATIVIKDSESRIVDIVEYSSLMKDFVSIERSDPTFFSDTDQDGIFDGWFFSLALKGATPQAQNDNEGFKEIDQKTLKVFSHRVQEQVVRNRPLINIGYAKDIPSSFAWKKFSRRDIAFLADKFSSFCKPLGIYSSFIEGDFQKETDGYASFNKGEEGLWRWKAVEGGSYNLKIIAEGESLSVAVKTGEGDFSDYLGPFLVKGKEVFCGHIEIKGISQSLEIKVRNDSSAKLKIINFILEPLYLVRGKININTAPEEILLVLFPKDIAEKIISHRPFGEKTSRKLGIGDLLLEDILGKDDETALENFKLVVPFLTTRSDVYQIKSWGETLNSQIKTVHKIDSIIKR